MTAGPGDCNFHSLRSNALGGDVLNGRAINGNYSRQARTVAFDQGADAAKIAFAFFAHVAGKDDCLGGTNPRLGKRTRQSDESSEAGPVVSNTWRGQAIGVTLDAHISGGGKNGVEMRDKKNDGFSVRAGTFGNDIAGFIRAHL